MIVVFHCRVNLTDIGIRGHEGRQPPDFHRHYNWAVLYAHGCWYRRVTSAVDVLVALVSTCWVDWALYHRIARVDGATALRKRTGGIAEMSRKAIGLSLAVPLTVSQLTRVTVAILSYLKTLTIFEVGNNIFVPHTAKVDSPGLIL